MHTDVSASPSSLPSPVLAARLAELRGVERNVLVDFLLHLDEFDRRRDWAAAGYGSLWTYCREVLHLRESSAGRRIAAVKLLRRFPSLEGALRDGRLSLTTVCELGKVLTEGNYDHDPDPDPRTQGPRPSGSWSPVTPSAGAA